MQRKTAATKKSAPRKSKSVPKPKAVSWSTDDVYNLLKAVNEQTLKRIEDYAKAAYTQIVERTSRLEINFLNQMKQDIREIKTKVGALTKGSMKASRGRKRKQTR